MDDMAPLPPNHQMLRLRDMLDGAGIEWHDNSDEIMCRTNNASDCGWDWTFSAICGRYAYRAIELWTKTMVEDKQAPIGLQTAEEAFELIREEVGK